MYPFDFSNTPYSAYQQGVDMSMGDYDGRTALHLAAVEGHARCVRFLLEVCAVPHDCKDRWGQTPLTEAIESKHIQVAAILRRFERSKAKKEKGIEVLKQWNVCSLKLVPTTIPTYISKRTLRETLLL